MNNSLLPLLLLPFSAISNAGFEPIADENLSNITGQSGVTIESDFHATIGSLEYKDQGIVAINEIEIGGANKATYFGKDWGASSHSGNKLDGSLVTIDILPDGDLVIAGSVDPKMGGGIIDFGITTGAVDLISADRLTSARLIDSISLSGIITKFRTKVDAQTSHFITEAEFGIDDLDIDFSGLNMKVENVLIAAPSYFESLEDWGAQGLALQDITVKASFDIFANDDGLMIESESLLFDMHVGSISIGNQQVGSVMLDDVNISQSSTLIKGHL